MDGLWGDSRKGYSFFSLRDGTYLDWRYFRHPDDYVVLTANEAGLVLGYVVVKASEFHGTVIGTVCDFVTWQDEVQVFAQLLCEAENYLRGAGVHYIQVICAETSAYFQVLSRAGYVVRRATPVIIFGGTELGRTLLQEKAKWHFTYGDSDIV